jgi:hypothetical protein
MTETAAASGAAAPSTPLWEDFVDIFAQPSAVYARRREGRYGLALLVLAALTAAVFFATRPLLQPMFDRMMDAQAEAMARQNPNMTEEQRASTKATMDRVSNVFVPLGAVVGAPVLVLITAGILFGVSRLGDAPVSYGQAATIVTYAQVPRLLGSLAGAGVLAVKDANELPPLQGALVGPVLLLPRDASPVLVGLLSRFDLFTLWATVLVGIGVAVMARRERSKGFVVAALLWAVATAWAVLSGLRAAAAMG